MFFINELLRIRRYVVNLTCIKNWLMQQGQYEFLSKENLK